MAFSALLLQYFVGPKVSNCQFWSRPHKILKSNIRGEFGLAKDFLRPPPQEKSFLGPKKLSCSVKVRWVSFVQNVFTEETLSSSFCLAQDIRLVLPALIFVRRKEFKEQPWTGKSNEIDSFVEIEQEARSVRFVRFVLVLIITHLHFQVLSINLQLISSSSINCHFDQSVQIEGWGPVAGKSMALL